MKTSANSNSMEWVGIAHNAAVRYAIGQLKLNSKRKPASDVITKLVTEYFSVAGVANPKRLPRKRPQDVKEAIESIEKKKIVTRKGTVAVSALFAAIKEKQTLRKLLAEIERQEDAAVDKLRGHDLLFFQGLASIARHSAKLWAPVKEGGEGIGDTGTARIVWSEVLAADCLGFMYGGVLGAVIFSLGDLIHQMA